MVALSLVWLDTVSFEGFLSKKCLTEVGFTFTVVRKTGFQTEGCLLCWEVHYNLRAVKPTPGMAWSAVSWVENYIKPQELMILCHILYFFLSLFFFMENFVLQGFKYIGNSLDWNLHAITLVLNCEFLVLNSSVSKYLIYRWAYSIINVLLFTHIRCSMKSSCLNYFSFHSRYISCKPHLQMR